MCPLFSPPLPERLSPWPRRARSAHLALKIERFSLSAARELWHEAIVEVLNQIYGKALELDALARGEEHIIEPNEGTVFDRVDAGRMTAARAFWNARTGAALEGDALYLSSAFVEGPGVYLPRDEVIALLEPLVWRWRQCSFPWLFRFNPCAIEPAPGEEALLRALEARSARWDDDFLLECNALGLLWGGGQTHAVDAKRRALAGWGLPRLGALVEARAAWVALIGDRARWAELGWSARSMDPPISLRYFIEGSGAPEGVPLMRWLGACEAIWQRIPERPVEAGVQGEWVAQVLGHRVALRFSVELGTAVLTGFRPAAADEPETPLLAKADRAREQALWRASLRLFARMGSSDYLPAAEDRRYLRWLADAWSPIESSIGGPDEASLGPRRSLLLYELGMGGVFQAHEAMRALLDAEGHAGLLRVSDAERALLRYLRSPERRAHTRYRFHGGRIGAWVSPLWFLQPDPAVRAFDFTARCEAVLHGAHLGQAWDGQVPATIDGREWIVRWRREMGLVPALSGVSAAP